MKEIIQNKKKIVTYNKNIISKIKILADKSKKKKDQELLFT